ncbi:MAG: efflux RND transporter permease subunit [Candidatus Binatia bacterium]
MIATILQFSIRQRLLVVFLTVGIAALGLWNFSRLPIDAVPDITNVQVQVNTSVTGLSPLEIEQRITFPIESSMVGLPGVEQVRSLSRYGLSQVTVVFQDGTDIYHARQLVNERLAEARGSLPAGLAEPIMGPIATGLGEIYMWSVEATGPKPDGSPYTDMELREIQDWIIRPQLRTVPGVTEVNSIGGYEKQFHVTPTPARLMAYGISFREFFERIAENNVNVGAGYIEHKGEQYLIRATGLVRTLEDMQNIIIGPRDGVPIYVKDVATVGLGKELRTGAATENGKEAVVGTAIMLFDENSRTVSRAVDVKMQAINKTLPANVQARTLYDRTYLVDATLHTVEKNLTEGAILVIAILFLLLGNIRAAFIVALAIPLSMLFAITGMVQNKISGNLMSLGAVDFGIIIDGAVVMVENIIRRLGEAQHRLGRTLSLSERADLSFTAAKEVARPTAFGVAIIMIVYLPILTLTGIEGKMFRPMAEVVLLALAGALILSFTAIPALCVLGLGGRISEKENILIIFIKRGYEPLLHWTLQHRTPVALGAGGLVITTLLIASRLGSEFIPKLSEGALALQPSRIPSISLTTSVKMQTRIEKVLLERFPDEVALVFARTGTAEVATDPMGLNISDTYIMLHPREQWTKAETQEELAEAIEKVIANLPGQNFEFSQPIELRFNELIAGVRAELAVKIFGDDLQQLANAGDKVAAVLNTIPGAADVKVEQVSGLPVLTVDIDRAAIARFGQNVSDVQGIIEIAMGGKSAGEVFQGDRRFDLVVRMPEDLRLDLEQLARLPIPLPPQEPERGMKRAQLLDYTEPQPAYIPLSRLAHIELKEGPNQISRENGKRRIVISANVRGRDLGSFVAEAQQKIDASVKLPEGYWITWGGQFENLIAARERLMVVVPLALFLIFLLLFASFHSVRLAALVFTGVPLALTGGVVALWLRGMPFTISAGVGFIALSGVAVLNGLVLVSFIRELRAGGLPVEEAVVQGCLRRLRPVLMTALVASLGFVPMALATSMGAEVQRPLATVVIGGILSSTFLTLMVLPAIYGWFDREQIHNA